MSKKNNIYSGRRIHMKRYISKIIVTILLAALCLPLNFVISNAASKDTKNVRSAYASVLKKKKYLNNQGDSSKPSFALADLNGDGVSELIISSTDDFLSKKDYFMYKNGKAVKIKTPKSDFYPVFGALYEMPSRGTYVFYRGGPGFDGENGTLVMPYMYYEYKLSKGKIKLVNEFEKREITDRKNRKTNKITKNGKKCSGREFNNVQNSLGNEIVFVANTKSNRQMKGVNTVIKKTTVKKKTTTKKTKTNKNLKIGNVRIGKDKATGKIKITWEKQNGTDGVILQYSKDNQFEGAKNVSITKSEWVFTNSVPFPCYIRVRPYALESGKKTFGAWIGLKLK